jgi:hypothetical protein
MHEGQVARNLKGMDDLDFTGWNSADWNGVFAQHHTDDVVTVARWVDGAITQEYIWS